LQPTPNPTRSGVPEVAILPGQTYTVQPGDTLAIIASAAGVTIDSIMTANSLANPNLLEVGQVLVIPDTSAPVATTGSTVSGPNFKIAPDSEVVYSPAAASFNLATYVKLKPGFLRAYSDELNDEFVSGVELVDEVARSYSVNPRLLLAIMEYRSEWLSEATVSEQAQQYPMGLIDPGREGLYPQLLDAANYLNEGYYGWKYRGLSVLTFPDGRTVNLAPDLNPGTAAIQYFFSRFNNLERWRIDVGETGFFQTYLSLFGDPFISAYEPIIPPGLAQPTLSFPFPANETWYFTGGPHGGYNAGSAWASIDFAPPPPSDELLAQQGFCYTSPFWVTAVAPGVIARSGKGYVILDLDMDGNEFTGWTIVYLHLKDNADLAQTGTVVSVGDPIGHPSCDGGFSTATHLHFGRRYNGEWVPVDCFGCTSDTPHAPMVLSGWTVRGYENAEYQGFMENAAGDFRRAEQGREDPINELRHSQ
jgi:murein DD-endopeptidase MepM/ murein hydrolase activator NlpD